MISFLLRVTCVIFERAINTDIWQAMGSALLSLSKTLGSHLKLVSHQGYPIGFRDWQGFFPVRLEPVSILVFFSSERKHG